MRGEKKRALLAPAAPVSGFLGSPHKVYSPGAAEVSLIREKIFGAQAERFA